MKFTAPPNWPQPPVGWTPPPGWSPDPAWGPAPEGWQFWIDDQDAVDDTTTPMPVASPARDADAPQNEAQRTGGGLGAAMSGTWARATRPFTRQDASAAEDSDGDGPSGSTSRTRRRVAVAAGTLALLVAGFGIGSAGSDPTSSEEYIALSSAKAQIEGNYASLQADHEELQADYDEMSSGLEEQEAAFEEREEAVKASEGRLKEREGKVKEAEAAVKKREEAVSGAEQKKAENTIREGTWTVGVDIAPGTYRSTSDVGSRCYWAILATGTNGDDIIANDIPGGGRPSVTIAEGQDFETKRCGSWQLQ